MLEFRRCSEAAVSLPPVFLIFDHALVEANGFGGLPPGYTEGLDWVSQGGTLREVAAFALLCAEQAAGGKV